MKSFKLFKPETLAQFGNTSSILLHGGCHIYPFSLAIGLRIL